MVKKSSKLFLKFKYETMNEILNKDGEIRISFSHVILSLDGKC